MGELQYDSDDPGTWRQHGAGRNGIFPLKIGRFSTHFFIIPVHIVHTDVIVGVRDEVDVQDRLIRGGLFRIELRGGDCVLRMAKEERRGS